MSMKMELLRALRAANEKIDIQMRNLKGFSEGLDKASAAVETVLGADDEYGRQMLDKLTQTKKQIEDTTGALQAAKDKLNTIGIAGVR